MHARSQTLLIGNPQQQGREETSLFRIQCGQKRVLVLTRNAADGLKDLLPLLGQLQQVDPTVARVVESLDQSPLLQLVDERHQPTREHSEPLCNLLLAGSRRARDDAQQPYVRGCQSEWTKSLGELYRRMGSDLRHEKCR